MWTANLFHVTTGAIGPRVSFKNVSWSMSLNETETLSLEVSKAELPQVDLNQWMSPWWAGVLLCYYGTPIFAGPITAIPSESFGGFKVECKGIRAVLERRLVINELDDWGRLAASKISFAGVSFSTIAQRVVKLSMDKPGGNLPISFPLPEVPMTPDKEHERNYQGYDLGNNSCDEVLTKLSGVIGGPDIMFRPRLLDGNSLTFDMWHGMTDNAPFIPQTNTPIWDTTAAMGQVTDLDMTTTGSYQTNRVFATGDGTNAQMKIRVAQDSKPLADGYPLLETVQNYSGVKILDTLQSHANANLVQNSKKLVEIQLSVRADGEHRLGSFWPGNRVKLVIKGWRSLPDGTHDLRLLNINGSDNNVIKMSLQTER